MRLAAAKGGMVVGGAEAGGHFIDQGWQTFWLTWVGPVLGEVKYELT